MAILINKDIRLNEDLITPQIYIRLDYKMGQDGSFIKVGLKHYTSKNSYLARNKYRVFLTDLPNFLSIYYDRNTHGVDILDHIHNEIREVLSNDAYEHGVKLRDPSTGQYVRDEFNNIVKDSIFIKERFCDYEDIEIVDMQDDIDPNEILANLNVTATNNEELTINNIEDGSIN